MYFTILDNTANAVDTFTSEREAVAALEAMVENDPEAADDLLLLRYDDDGNPVGEALEASIVQPVLKNLDASRVVMVAWRGACLALEAILPEQRHGTSIYAAGVGQRLVAQRPVGAGNDALAKPVA